MLLNNYLFKIKGKTRNKILRFSHKRLVPICVRNLPYPTAASTHSAPYVFNPILDAVSYHPPRTAIFLSRDQAQPQIDFYNLFRNPSANFRENWVGPSSIERPWYASLTSFTSSFTTFFSGNNSNSGSGSGSGSSSNGASNGSGSSGQPIHVKLQNHVFFCNFIDAQGKIRIAIAIPIEQNGIVLTDKMLVYPLTHAPKVIMQCKELDVFFLPKINGQIIDLLGKALPQGICMPYIKQTKDLHLLNPKHCENYFNLDVRLLAEKFVLTNAKFINLLLTQDSDYANHFIMFDTVLSSMDDFLDFKNSFK